MTTPVEDTLEIQALLARFANSFDTKDWQGLQACLAEELRTDYSDLRGTPAGTIRAGAYVSARRESLRDLETHHLGGNLEIGLDGQLQATCRLSMVIWRRSGKGEFNTHCIYTFGLSKIDDKWKITGITQKVLWSDGLPAVHGGAQPER